MSGVKIYAVENGNQPEGIFTCYMTTADTNLFTTTFTIEADPTAAPAGERDLAECFNQTSDTELQGLLTGLELNLENKDPYCLRTTVAQNFAPWFKAQDKYLFKSRILLGLKCLNPEILTRLVYYTV